MRPSDSGAASSRPRPDHRRRTRRAASVLVAALVVLAVPAALALASSRAPRRATVHPVVDAAHSAKLSATIVVDAKGRTLYTLSGETTHHLLCTSAQCLKFWPPVTVASTRAVLRAGPGVKGKLGTLKRPGGVVQLTFRGLPLYRFLADTAPGDVNGQLIASFGGVWHAVAAASGVVTTAPKTQTTSSSTSSAAAPASPAITSPSVSSTSTAAGNAPAPVTSAATTTTVAATTTMPVMTTTSTSSACTPYYVGAYYYPCP